MESDLPLTMTGATAGSQSARPAAALRSLAQTQGPIVLLVGLFAAAVAALGRVVVSADGWLALLAGRLVAQHGIPMRDTLTIFGHGRRWVDQQWLAQIGLYEFDRLGGLRFEVVAQVILLAGSLAAAIALARRRGAGAKAVAVIVAVAFLPLLVSSLQVRTQSFAYPLFLAVLAITAGRRPFTWKRLALCIALLCLWANLHGSVILGAGLVALRGISDLVDELRLRRRPSLPTSAAIILPWPCLLVTPFPLAVPRYYAETVFNPTFGQYLVQWQPSTLSPISVPLFALAFGLVWLLARSPSSFSRFEKLATLALVVFGLLAIRNWVWLALGAVVLYPLALERSSAKYFRPLPAALSQVCALAGAVFVIVAGVPLSHAQSWFDGAYPNQVAAVVARLAAAAPHARIWTSARWADWLLWKQPQLEGRIAYDVRYEIYTSQQLKTMTLARATPALLPQLRRRYSIFVVERASESAVFATLRREGNVAYDDGGVLVVSFSRARAG